MRITTLACISAPLAVSLSTQCAALTWAKGNLHTHTSESDADTPPAAAAAWYREHGYDFLVISDHSKITDVTSLDSPGFLVISGEETAVKNAKPSIHANSIGSAQCVDAPSMLASKGDTLNELVARIREAGGIPMINHPNFEWSFGHREIAAVEGTFLLEVFNGHPSVNNFGNAAFLPVEQTWDILLSQGKRVYAAATDDTHHFRSIGPQFANPGRGWVCVRVNELSKQAVLSALSAGEFYASTGVELTEYEFDGMKLHVSVAQKPGKTYILRFIGSWGRILHEEEALSADFHLSAVPETQYVRCKVICSDGTVAWTQAHQR